MGVQDGPSALEDLHKERVLRVPAELDLFTDDGVVAHRQGGRPVQSPRVEQDVRDAGDPRRGEHTVRASPQDLRSWVSASFAKRSLL